MSQKDERPYWERQSPYWRIQEPTDTPKWPRIKKGDGWYCRGSLPHYHRDQLFQHVTIHLADSLPAKAIKRIQWSLRHQPDNLRKILIKKRLDRFLDAGAGACYFRVPELAQMMEETLHFFDGARFELHHWVIMPNHIHVLFRCKGGWHMADIVATWKRRSAIQINQFLRCANRAIGAPNAPASLPTFSDRSRQQAKQIWHKEYWDRFIRSEEHYRRVVDYIFNNPTKAGLVQKVTDWPWSSARYFFEEKGNA